MDDTNGYNILLKKAESSWRERYDQNNNDKNISQSKLLEYLL